jgi:murein DD-endopeptidase MepM/ murein hydrolase activator NlpD
MNRIAAALTTSALLAAVTLLAPGGGPLSPSGAEAYKLGQRTLKMGMKGKDVRALQRGLTRMKLRTRADGRFGRTTKRNVVRLEKRFGWRPVNGRVTPLEAKRLKGKVNAQRRAKLERQRKAAGGQVFPIVGPHDYGGSQARFGAGRSGHSHQGQDVFAPCGARLLSAQAGRITTKAYQGSGAGYYLVVKGTDGYDYVYMHMQKASWAANGTKLYAGQQIGRVGDSGNASGCHLHFEMWTSPGWYAGGKPIDPYPNLKAWDAYS